MARTGSDEEASGLDGLFRPREARPGKRRARLSHSAGLAAWLAETDVSIAFTTYRSGKLAFLGRKPNGRLSVTDVYFRRAMGLAVSDDGRSMLLASLDHVVRLNNIIPRQGEHQGWDALFVPHISWTTGYVDAHDVAFPKGRRPLFVNTAFSCIARVSPDHSFEVLWRPSFISQTKAEDRCHLNGLAMVDDRPRYATLLARSDEPFGWRENMLNGGELIDLRSGEALLTGLSMPHSPRFHDGRLWLLNSGAGELGYYDERSGRFEAVAFCRGYARGLAFIGPYAVVGLSKPREGRAFDGLALKEGLQHRGLSPCCGMQIIDTRSGKTAEWFYLGGAIDEMFDVAVLKGLRRPTALGPKSERLHSAINFSDLGEPSEP